MCALSATMSHGEQYCHGESPQVDQWTVICGLYLRFGGQTLEAKAGGGQHLKSFCWITLLLNATDSH